MTVARSLPQLDLGQKILILGRSIFSFRSLRTQQAQVDQVIHGPGQNGHQNGHDNHFLDAVEGTDPELPDLK